MPFGLLPVPHLLQIACNKWRQYSFLATQCQLDSTQRLLLPVEWLICDLNGPICYHARFPTTIVLATSWLVDLMRSCRPASALALECPRTLLHISFAGCDAQLLQNFSQTFAHKKLFPLETIFHKVFLIKPFVLLTMELSLRTLAVWPVTRPSLAVPLKSNTAPETFAFLPPELSWPILAAPSSSNSITSSAASRKISAGKFPTNASCVSKTSNPSPRRSRVLPPRKFSARRLPNPNLSKPTPLTLPLVLRFFR